MNTVSKTDSDPGLLALDEKDKQVPKQGCEFFLCVCEIFLRATEACGKVRHPQMYSLLFPWHLEQLLASSSCSINAWVSETEDWEMGCFRHGVQRRPLQRGDTFELNPKLMEGATCDDLEKSNPDLGTC